ncbi:MAG: S41 family peptidase [Gemmatimonadota bacterium]
MTRRIRTALSIPTVALAACVSAETLRQVGGRDLALESLKRIHAELKRSYYDPKLGGHDMESHYKAAEAEILRATSDQQRFRALSNFLLPLDDSHTYFAGGTPITLGDFGFSYRFYGEAAFVSAVNDWSAADSMGLRRGDEILKFAGQSLTRENQYRVLVDFLGQHPIATLDLDVRAPDRSISRIAITADTAALFKMSGRDYRELHVSARDSVKLASGHMTTSLQNRIFVWRPPDIEWADLQLGKVARLAGKHEVLVLDLRGNPGGPVSKLKEALAYFIDRPVDIGTLRMRWDEEKYKAKPSADRYQGKLYVLVDSETASASEVLARLIQLEKTGIIVGDRTSGAVMASMTFGEASITVSDFVLHNGERLEKIGVMPDIKVIANAKQIADGDDPVLAHVLSLEGIRATPAQAAKINQTKR